MSALLLITHALPSLSVLQSAVATRLALGRTNRLQSPTTSLHALAVNARGALVAAISFLARMVDV